MVNFNAYVYFPPRVHIVDNCIVVRVKLPMDGMMFGSEFKLRMSNEISKMNVKQFGEMVKAETEARLKTESVFVHVIEQHTF